MWKNFCDTFYLNFIEEGRWHYIADGLVVTLQLTFFALILGIIIGLIVGIIRTTYEKTHKLKVLNFYCNPRNSGSSSAFDYVLCYFWKLQN